MTTSNPTERLALVGVINPADLATTAASTAWVDMAKFAQLVGYVIGGALTGTLDAKFQQATSSAGAGAKDVTGKAMTQFAATDDNKQVQLNLRAEQLDMDNDFRYARLTVTPTGGTTNLASAVLFGVDPKYTPTSADDLTTVVQTV